MLTADAQVHAAWDGAVEPPTKKQQLDFQGGSEAE
jgi:hypothetical protein